MSLGWAREKAQGLVEVGVSKCEVLGDRERGEGAAPLEHDADPTSGPPVRRSVQRAAVGEHALVPPQEPRDRQQRRRLPGAVPQQADDLTRGDTEADVVDDGQRPMRGQPCASGAGTSPPDRPSAPSPRQRTWADRRRLWHPVPGIVALGAACRYGVHGRPDQAGRRTRGDICAGGVAGRRASGRIARGCFVQRRR